MRSRLAYCVFGGALLAGVGNCFPIPVAAQPGTQAQDGLEEVVVTARKRTESAQSVPISMTALSGVDLQARGVVALNDVAEFAPNLTFDAGARSQGGSLSSSIFIRGVGQSDFSALAEPGVGIYIDGVYFGRSLGSVLETLDLDRVEVLRGPQGTLFGRNTIGGAISVISKMPADDFEASVQLGYGEFDERLAKATLSLPLSSTFAIRLSVAARDRDGYEHSRASGINMDDVNTRAARLVARWLPGDDFSATTIIDGTRQREAGQAQHIVAVDTQAPALALFNELVAPGTPYGLFDSRYITAGQRYNYANNELSSGVNANNLDNYGVSETLAWKIAPALALTSISAYRGLDGVVGTDVDGTPFHFQEATNTLAQHQFSEELRLNGSSFADRLDWIAGLYYFQEEFNELQQQRVFPGLYEATQIAAFDVTPNQLMSSDNRSMAGYLDATVHLTSRLSATAGLRYSHDKKDVLGSSTTVLSGQVFLPPGSRLTPSWGAWTPKGSLDYKLSEDALVYVSVAKGFKEGGVNDTITSPSDFQTYGPEHQTTVEAGVKSEWFDRRLRVNADIFDSSYSGLQLRATLVPGQLNWPPGLVSACQTIVNAARMRIEGSEIEIVSEPVRHLNLLLGMGYIDARFTSIDPTLIAADVLTYGTQLPKTPKWSIDPGAQYDLTVGSAGSLTLRADYAFRSRTYQDIENSPQIVQPGFGLLNGRIAFTTANERLELALAGQNLTNKFYITSGFAALSSLGLAEVAYGEPRTWTATAKYSFQ